jgi:hypothetical protein
LIVIHAEFLRWNALIANPQSILYSLLQILAVALRDGRWRRDFSIKTVCNFIPKEFTAVDEANSSAKKSKVGTQSLGTIAGRITLLLAVAVLGGSFAFSKLLTVFQKYDDEGYLLLSLKHYLNGSRLYTDTLHPLLYENPPDSIDHALGGRVVLRRTTS